MHEMISGEFPSFYVILASWQKREAFTPPPSIAKIQMSFLMVSNISIILNQNCLPMIYLKYGVKFQDKGAGKDEGLVTWRGGIRAALVLLLSISCSVLPYF